MFGIDGVGNGDGGQVMVRREVFAAMARLVPGGIRTVAAPPHFFHDEAMVGVEQVGAVGEDVVDGRVCPSPAVTAQGSTFAVLPQQLLTGQVGDECLMPESHGQSSFCSSSRR